MTSSFTVRVKKNATNVPQRLLKTWRHERHFSPTKVPHFDGRTAVRHLVKRRNPSIAALYKTVQGSRYYGAFGKKRCNSIYPGASCINHKSAVQFLIKKRHTHFTNCCILFDAHCRLTHVVAQHGKQLVNNVP